MSARRRPLLAFEMGHSRGCGCRAQNSRGLRMCEGRIAAHRADSDAASNGMPTDRRTVARPSTFPSMGAAARRWSAGLTRGHGREPSTGPDMPVAHWAGHRVVPPLPDGLARTNAANIPCGPKVHGPTLFHSALPILAGLE